MKRYLLGIIILLVSAVLIFGCGSTSDNTDVPTLPTKIYLFRSEYTVSGNMGGRVGADALVAASSHKPTGSYTIHAFISVSSTDDIKSMPTNYGFPNNVPIVSVSGNAPVADNWADLLDGDLDLALMDLAVGVLPSGKSPSWWSGSNFDGTVSQNCTGWTDDLGHTRGVIGYAHATNNDWLSGSTSSGNYNNKYVLGIAY